MADITKITLPNSKNYDIRDYRVPQRPESTNTYLRGDGSWEIPAINYSAKVTFIDCGDHLYVNISS